MENTFHEVYFDVEKAIDLAFKGKFVLKFYDYLKIKGTKRIEVVLMIFINNFEKVMVIFQNQRQEKYEIICMAF